MKFSVKNEFDTLKKVVLGIGADFGGTPSIQDVYDPHSRKHVLQKTYPKEDKIVSEFTERLNFFNLLIACIYEIIFYCIFAPLILNPFLC